MSPWFIGHGAEQFGEGNHGISFSRSLRHEGERALPGRDDISARRARRTAIACSTASWLQAATSSTRPSVYGAGVSEEVVGRWLKTQRRDDLVIATKVRFPMGEGPNDVGLSRKHILSSVEASLRRLQHRLHRSLTRCTAGTGDTPLEETLSAWTPGASARCATWAPATIPAWQLQKAVDLSQAHGLGGVRLRCSLSITCSIAPTEWELAPVCANEGLGIIPWSPLRGGWLSGKYRRGMASAAGRHARRSWRKQRWGESWTRMRTTAPGTSSTC